jgi:hypothetical protein
MYDIIVLSGIVIACWYGLQLLHVPIFGVHTFAFACASFSVLISLDLLPIRIQYKVAFLLPYLVLIAVLKEIYDSMFSYGDLLQGLLGGFLMFVFLQIVSIQRVRMSPKEVDVKIHGYCTHVQIPYVTRRCSICMKEYRHCPECSGVVQNGKCPTCEEVA